MLDQKRGIRVPFNCLVHAFPDAFEASLENSLVHHFSGHRL